MVWCNVLVVWLDRYISKLGFDMWLVIKYLQLYKNISSKYVKKVLNIRYRIKENRDDAKYETENRSCKKIRKYLIIGLDKYNI